MSHLPRVLFILKKRNLPFYDTTSGDYTMSSGLLNSASFVVEMLQKSGIETKLVQVTDNNCIDREVTNFRPTHVIIEAYWVVPEKFDTLHILHPSVTWIVRVHSEVPFLAQDGMSFEWTFKYLHYSNVHVAFNSWYTLQDFRLLAQSAKNALSRKEIDERIIYLPNYYSVGQYTSSYQLDKKQTIDVGCFGAIRPLKNQLIQAVAVIQYAKKHHLNLRYHINGHRKESGGDTPLKNIRALFAATDPKYQLVEHSWYTHTEFIRVLRQMDIGLQVSFTESFNIVTADFVDNGIPVVTSKEIEWVSCLFHADPTRTDDIVAKMERALWWKRHLSCIDLNYKHLKYFSAESAHIWKRYLGQGTD